MSQDKMEFTTGIGRWVGGSIWKGSDKDDKGVPLIYSKGAKQGEPFQKISFGVAFSKQDPSFAQLKQQVEAEAARLWPQGQTQNPSFAWKIVDGDSTIPNSKGNKPCDREGYPGNWVVWFQGTEDLEALPRVYDMDRMQINDENLLRRGYYVRVIGTVTSNENNNKPGIYFNYQLIQLQGYGTVIQGGPDVDTALGTQATYVPEGMSTTAPPATTPPAPSAAPVAPPAAAAPPVPPTPPAPAAVPAPPPPPAPATDFAEGPKMCKDGNTVQSYLDAGWTEDQLMQQGLI